MTHDKMLVITSPIYLGKKMIWKSTSSTIPILTLIVPPRAYFYLGKQALAFRRDQDILGHHWDKLRFLSVYCCQQPRKLLISHINTFKSYGANHTLFTTPISHQWSLFGKNYETLELSSITVRKGSDLLCVSSLINFWTRNKRRQFLQIPIHCHTQTHMY